MIIIQKIFIRISIPLRKRNACELGRECHRISNHSSQLLFLLNNNILGVLGKYCDSDHWVFKVQLFWEGHKICLVNVKTMRKIAQIFVAFSEKLNFITIRKWTFSYETNWVCIHTKFSREHSNQAKLPWHTLKEAMYHFYGCGIGNGFFTAYLLDRAY